MDYLSPDDRSLAPLTASLFSPRQPRPASQSINYLLSDIEPFDSLFPALDLFLDFPTDYVTASTIFEENALFPVNNQHSQTVLQSIQQSNIADQPTSINNQSVLPTISNRIKIEVSGPVIQSKQSVSVSADDSNHSECRMTLTKTQGWHAMLNSVVRRLEKDKFQLESIAHKESTNASEKRVVSPRAVADRVYVLGQLFEVMPNLTFGHFIRKLGYTPTPAPTFLDPDRCVWTSVQSNMPRVSLPYRFRTDWSYSPLQSLPDNPSSINVATLTYERPANVKLYAHDTGFIAVEIGKPRTKQYPNEREVSLSDVDLSVCSLPIVVQVNAAFERLFGFTQVEVRNWFIREGMGAMYRFNEPEMMQKIHEKTVNGIVEGHCEFSHKIDILTKYGLPLKTVLTNRLFLNEGGVTIRHVFVYVPMPV